MSSQTLAASRGQQIVLILILPVLAFIVGAIFLPTPETMRSARAGADRDALADVLSKTAPTPATPLDITLDRVGVLGVELPDEPLSRGERFEITTFFSSKRATDKDWTVFMHIDRRGGAYRIHGDHEPVDGRYPTSLWQPGEYITDVFARRVPVDAPKGTYEVWMGLYIKDDRMRFTRGDKTLHDGKNRVLIGTIEVK